MGRRESRGSERVGRGREREAKGGGRGRERKGRASGGCRPGGKKEGSGRAGMAAARWRRRSVGNGRTRGGQGEGTFF